MTKQSLTFIVLHVIKIKIDMVLLIQQHAINEQLLLTSMIYIEIGTPFKSNV